MKNFIRINILIYKLDFLPHLKLSSLTNFYFLQKVLKVFYLLLFLYATKFASINQPSSKMLYKIYSHILNNYKNLSYCYSIPHLRIIKSWMERP